MSKFKIEDGYGRDCEESSVYDKLDSLPKHVSNGKEMGSWGHRRSKINWHKIDRWIKSKIGHHVDDVFSEYVKMAKDKSTDYEIEVLKKAFYRNLTEVWGDPDVFISKRYGYPYLGIHTESGHIVHIGKHDLFINNKGIISKVPKDKINKHQKIRMQQQRDVYSQRVLWVDNRAFICLENQWFEVIYNKVDYHALGWQAYYATKCVLCKKLRANWYHDHFRIFGRDVAAITLRSMSYDDVERFLI